MKKLLSLFLAVLMVASIVAMMPVFSVSAAVDTSALTQNNDPSSPAYGRYLIPGTVDGGNGCGFVDGNARPADKAAHGFSVLLGTADGNTILDKCQIYVNGNKATLCKTYKGYQHIGRNGDDGIFYGVIGTGMTKGQESEMILLIGDDYYMQGTLGAANSTTHAVVSSNTVLYTGSDMLVSTVTFADASAFNVGDTMTVRFHDNHYNVNIAEVVAKDGNTVTIKAEKCYTNNTLCEFTLSDDSKFSVAINATDTFYIVDGAYGYLQTKNGANEGEIDVRVIAEATKEVLDQYNRIGIQLTFTLKDGTKKAFDEITSTEFYRSVSTSEGSYAAKDGYYLFGCVVTGVPVGVDKVDANVKLYNDEEGTNRVIDLGSGNLAETASANVDDVRKQTLIPATSITVNKFNGNADIGSGESSPARLFDGTTKKLGTGNVNYTVDFTLDQAVALTGIIFSVGNDSRAYERSIKSWQLKAKRDDGSWAVIASWGRYLTLGENYDDNAITDPDLLPNGSREAFTLKNVAEYKEYQLVVEGKPNTFNQLGEISLYINGLDYIKDEMQKYGNVGNITVTKYTGNNKDGATGNDIPSGGEQNPYNLFDGKTNKHGDGRTADNGGFIVEFSTKSAIAITGIIFTHGNDSAGSNRYYTYWKLEAKDAGGNWVTVYECKGGMERPGTTSYDSNAITDPEAVADIQRVAYLVDNTTAYSEYRLSAKGNGGNYNQMGEVTFYTAKAQ